MTTAHLIALSDKAYERLRTRLEGLTDDEYLWEPAPGAWSVRDTRHGVRFDFALLPDDPAPITTIAWRLTHVIDLLKEDRCAILLGLEPDANAAEIWVTTSATAALDMLDRAFATWRGYLTAADDARFGEPAGRWPDRHTFALHIIDELIHHAAEVALLRDLHQATRSVDTDLAAVLDGDTSRVDALRARRPAVVAELAAAGRWEEAATLVDLGLDVDPPGVRASPLHHAAGMGRLALVRTLVERGTNTQAIDEIYHTTPLAWARTMSARLGGPNSIGAEYDAVIDYLQDR